MIEYLNSIDTELLLYINSLHNAYLDNFMYLVSGKWVWMPMYALILIAMIQKNWRQALFVLLIAVLAIAIADQISSGIIKHSVERLRPTHEPAIANLVHVVKEYRGGRFGFVSSHAANTVAFALLFSLLFRNRWFSLSVAAWAALVMYSRMYLGVHYPGDILGGIVVGAVSGIICYYAYTYIARNASHNEKLYWMKANNWNNPVIAMQTSNALAIIIVVMCLILTVLAFFMF